MTNNEIMDLADRAANDAIASIQDALNIPSGDFAALYFTGDRWSLLLSVLGDYIRAEIQQGANHD